MFVYDVLLLLAMCVILVVIRVVYFARLDITVIYVFFSPHYNTS